MLDQIAPNRLLIKTKKYLITGIKITTPKTDSPQTLQHPNHKSNNHSPHTHRHLIRRARKHRHRRRLRRRRISRRIPTLHQLKVCTRNPRRIRRMKHKAQSTKEALTPLLGAQIRIHKFGVKGTGRSNLAAMLARQIAHLTRLRRSSIAHDVLAAIGGVEMRQRGCAVSIGWDREGVDVPVEGAQGGLVGEVGDVDGESCAGGLTYGFDAALHHGPDERVEHARGECGAVGCRRLVGDGRGGAKEPRVAWLGRHRGDDSPLESGDAGEGGLGGEFREDTGFRAVQELGRGRRCLLDLHLLGGGQG